MNSYLYIEGDKLGRSSAFSTVITSGNKSERKGDFWKPESFLTNVQWLIIWISGTGTELSQPVWSVCRHDFIRQLHYPVCLDPLLMEYRHLKDDFAWPVPFPSGPHAEAPYAALLGPLPSVLTGASSAAGGGPVRYHLGRRGFLGLEAFSYNIGNPGRLGKTSSLRSATGKTKTSASCLSYLEFLWW